MNMSLNGPYWADENAVLGSPRVRLDACVEQVARLTGPARFVWWDNESGYARQVVRVLQDVAGGRSMSLSAPLNNVGALGHEA